MKRLLLAALPAMALVTPAHADPLSIGVAVLVNIGWAGTITAGLAIAVGVGVIGVGVLGASLLAGSLAPRNEVKPSERQSTVRQAVGPRVRFYGRVKVGGTMWFFDTSSVANPFGRGGSHLYIGVTLNEGEISQVAEIWLNDEQIAIDGNGEVTTSAYVGTAGTFVILKFKLGTSSQTVHAQLDSAFSVVNSNHRLRGVANALAIFSETRPEDAATVYPQYIPQLRIVMDASVVKSVATGLTGYSDNLGNVVYDYLTAVDGAGYPYGAGMLESQVDLPSFQSYAALADQPVDLKAGGTVQRYNVGGGYGLNEEMRAVLPRLLAAGDADLFLTPSGKVGIRGGRWVEPVLTLDADLGHIISAEFRKGQGRLAAFNELTVVYTEPTQDYQEAEAAVWVDSENFELRGKALSEKLDVLMVPNHSQARRIAKIHTHKSNPRWIGTVVTNFYGLNAIGEETVRIRFQPLGIDESFIIKGLRFLENFSGVELTVSSLDASAYAWDAATEEGNGPSVPPDTSDTVITGSVTGVSATPGAGAVDLDWTQPSDTNVAGARIFRNATNVFASATRITTVFGGASAVLTYTDPVPPGDYYYWVVAINGSGLEATEVATGLVTVAG